MSMTESTSRSHQLSGEWFLVPINSNLILFMKIVPFDILPTVVERKRVVSHNYNGETHVGIYITRDGFKGCWYRVPWISILEGTDPYDQHCSCFSKTRKWGTSAYRIDFLGNGESQGSFQYGNYRREAEDLRAVVQFLISCAGRSNYCNYWPQQRFVIVSWVDFIIHKRKRRGFLSIVLKSLTVYMG